MKLLYIAFTALVSLAQAQTEIHRIKLTEDGKVESMTEEQVFELVRNGQHFFDITNQTETKSIQSFTAVPLPSKLSYADIVRAAHKKVDSAAMTSFLTQYSAFPNRYYANPNGAKAAGFLLEQVKQAGKGFPGKFSANFFNHAWVQPSIIARLEGSESPDEIVVVGAHLDSINQRNPMNGIAPGADDDGSGTTSVLEALRSLAKSGFTPRRTVEFQFYAAEEIGLRGSQDIANKYAKDKKNVVGMLQLDMTGYNEQKRIRVLTDYTDPELTQFVRTLIDTYGTYKWFNGRCGYACSDHASYNKAGFRSVQPGEDVVNYRLHTPQDTMEFVNMNHAAEFSRLAISFIVELAFPSSA